ncbi:MAG TPA: hypothetical protein VIL74_16350 [Pyrinomonadaceae bacterium]
MKIFRPISPVLLVFIFCAVVYAEPFRCFAGDDGKPMIVKMPVDGGIREDIPGKYKERFARWKEELLSTGFGREQWEAYARNKNFILTIAMSDKRGQGAGTDEYLWDEEGNFVGATITLGTKIDKGYPDPIYYPVMNSLASDENLFSTSGALLAATKIAHEIGHVNQTAKANRETIALQNRLMPQYISIFLKNGRNTRDKELVALAEKMGGTPVEIWENREYWSEVTAMSYLKERISRENFYCHVFNKIRYNIEQYAKDYEDRFEEVTDLTANTCRNK